MVIRSYGLVVSFSTLLILSTGCSGPWTDMAVAPSVRSRLSDMPHSGADLKVMSFNIRVDTMLDVKDHWLVRRDLLVQTIHNFNPDLLGTQECQASQAEYLAQALPGYQFVGAGRNDGGRGGEMCAIFFKADRFRRLDYGSFWLSQTPQVPGSKSWGSWFPRMVTWVKLRPADGGPDFYFFNTHLDIAGDFARTEQARLLHQQIARIARAAPVVITGDFNADEGTLPYQVLTASRSPRFADTLRAVQPQPLPGEGTRHGFLGVQHGPRIDWILTSSHFTTITATIDRTNAGVWYPSDHFPVTAVLRLTPAVAAGSSSASGM